MREIVTIQLGGYANFVGSHFWNLQDESLSQITDPQNTELSPDVFLREVRDRGSRTSFVPRLQIIDLTGAFGSLSLHAGYSVPRTSELRQSAQGHTSNVSPEDDALLWHGAYKRYERPKINASPFLQTIEAEERTGEVHAPNILTEAGATSMRASKDLEDGITPDYGLDSSVRFWSDYLKVILHPRTCRSVTGIHHGVNDFTMFGSGVSAATGQMLDDAFDDLRYFLEDCDCLGGLVLNCDVHNGFSGFSARYLGHIYEELGTSLPVCIVGAASAPPRCPTSETQSLRAELVERKLNEALLLSAAIENSAQYMPLSATCTTDFPYVHPDVSNPFQTSAVLGSAVDVFLSPLRHIGSHMTMSGLFTALRPSPFAVLNSVGLGLPIVESVSFEQSALREVAGLMQLSSKPGDATLTKFEMNHESRRGSCTGSLPVKELVLGRGISGTADLFSEISTRVAVPVPFPRFFDRRIDMTGHLLPLEIANKRPRLGEVGELSALASLYIDSKEGHSYLSDAADTLARTARTSQSVRGMLEPETVRESAELMQGLAGDYMTM